VIDTRVDTLVEVQRGPAKTMPDRKAAPAPANRPRGARHRRAAPPSRRARAGAIAGCCWGMLLRDFAVLRHNTGEFLLRTLAQPLLFIFVFAYLFPRIGQGVGGGSDRFASVLIPGLVAVTAVFSGVSSVSLPLAIEFGATREIEDRVMSPVPLWAVGGEKIVFGALQSLVSASLVLPLGLLISAASVSLDVQNPLLLVAVIVMACWISGALGLAVGTLVAPQRMGLVFSVLVVPLTFLGCVYYPWYALRPLPWLHVGVLANPLSYVSEGLRATITPSVPHMGAVVYLGVGLLFSAALTGAGMHLFARRVTRL
jgi:ABC-2 type transport system permease protein